MSTPSAKQQTKTAGLGALGIVTGAVALALSVNAYFGGRYAEQDLERVTKAEELRVLSQQIAKNAAEAARGKKEAFNYLNQTRGDFERIINALNAGDPTTGLPPADDQIKSAELAQARKLWEQVRGAADTILGAKDTVLDLNNVATDLGQTIPQLQYEYNKVIDILLEKRAPAEQVHFATRQSWYAERVIRSIQKVLAGGEDAQVAAENFGHDVDLFGKVVTGMLDGDQVMNISRVEDEEARTALSEIANMFTGVQDNVGYIIKSTGDLFKVHNASDRTFVDSQALLEKTRNLSTAFANFSSKRTFGSDKLNYPLGAALLVLLVLLGLRYNKLQKERLAEEGAARAKEKEFNERNQQAIIRLLDEIEGLADGDLSSNATVSEDFTGAIADALNFTIDQLRGLVATINETVVRVGGATDETRAISGELAQASRNQAQEIAGASAAINEMAVSIEQVSANASQSAQVADKSVGIAKKGADVVNNTIRGMDTIREQIQDTSKRIKRLGESSQEIGDIVSLINDIADQTNILALNAAIQAAMAGESGRGFAVVADEVQRLAERSGNATKQIEALVKAIQTDTNEAVISMESTTTEVVRGARLAQDAGVALEEIESVSKHLADLIQNISNAARQQAASAGHVSNTMHVIQEITNQTSTGTQNTAGAIGKLAELAEELRSSVAGFKLPA
ncbi:MAG: type IV pili methyl-accepting chemotaxis transducer N-terminal domain-containing protein [Gammaproteobacteria bacterium]|nr:type IV pili methyl-accepting chemotaxis transducer N-terminal domain-containing protein [Gammaproteobacteria bacterium]